jgi:single-strand DNA-binding protein
MINNVVLVGRLANDPEMRYAQSGTEITTFRVAVSRPPRDGAEEETDWLNVVCFGRTAEACANYLDKGSLVGIEGRIQTRSYEQNGQRQWWTEINARNVQFLESRQEAERRRQAQGQPGPGQRQQQQPPAGQSYGAQGGGQQQGGQQQGSQNPPQEFGDMEENGDPFGDV